MKAMKERKKTAFRPVKSINLWDIHLNFFEKRMSSIDGVFDIIFKFSTVEKL